MAKVKTSSTPGARESNAGDEFHVLWAARRAVQLLNPRSNLFRVVMEGVSPNDAEKTTDDEKLLLGVDLTEYYGGDEFSTATQVVISQLKYSQRHPNTAWTASRLCESKNTDKTNSVIRRLADSYKKFLTSSSREEVLKKLCIRLVSNQPADQNLLSALKFTKDFLNVQPATSVINTNVLLQEFSKAERELEAKEELKAQEKLQAQKKLQTQKNIIEKLKTTANLQSRQFTDFLRVFDLSTCGEESRNFQRLRLIQELSPSVTNDLVSALRDLCDLIRNEAQPEREKSIGLSMEDILACLGVGHIDNLFPSPSRLQTAKYPIETSDIKNLTELILYNSNRKILAHGTAGVGKTTSVQSLINHLPPGSVVIIYDCYGGGEYLITGEQRHTHKRAFTQITNELAVSCGTPFLVQTAYDIEDLQRSFRKSLEMASKVIASQGGLLVVVIDAADNAIIAANASGDNKNCFVPALWNIPFPDKCKLLMTSRSHRSASLQPLPDVEYLLQGFDQQASIAYLQKFFPDANSSDGAVFHERTDGNPRVQSYLLSNKEAPCFDKVELEELLKISQRTPNDIFADLLEAAVKHSTQPENSKQQLAILVYLTRPVPIHIFADACGISFDEARSFCQALEPGLILRKDEVSFRDEDFETYLRDQIKPHEVIDVQKHLGRYFLEYVNQNNYENSYAHKIVAEHLFQGELYQEVVNLAINGPEPIVQDQLHRLQIQRRRITLAMQAACQINLTEEAVRLILLAAETSRSNGALTALIRENPELTAMYGDTNSVARLYLREENNSWLGSVHLRTAAMYARDPAQHEYAKQQLGAAKAWIRRRAALPEHERYHWGINAFDIACVAEAVFWLDGAEAAQSWLSNWHPRSAIISATEELAKSLAVQLSPEQQEQLFIQLKLPLWAKILFLATFDYINTKLSNTFISKIESILEVLTQGIKKGRKFTQIKSTWITSLCELAASNGLNTKDLLEISKAFSSKLPERVPYDNADLLTYILPLQTICLQYELANKDISTNELLPENYRPKQGQKEPYQYESERRKFNETIGRLLNIYKIRANAIVKQLTVEDVLEQISQELNQQIQESSHRWFQPDLRYEIWANKACEALINCSGDASFILEKIANAAEPLMHGAAPRLWLDMARLLVPNEKTYRVLGYRLLERVAQYVTEKPFPGSDRWKNILECAVVVNQYDEEQGREYYKRSLAAAEGIDDESTYLLSLQAYFGYRIGLSLPFQERQDFAARLANVVEAFKDYVSEPSILPWEETLASVSHLDAASGMALCSRWDDENHLLLEDGIIPVVRETTASGFLSPLEGLWLLRLAGEEYDVSKDAIQLLEKIRAKGIPSRPQLVQMMREISFSICRDIPIEKREEAATIVLNWASQYSMETIAGIADLRELLSFVSSMSPKNRLDEPSSSMDIDNEENEAAIKQFVNSTRSGDFEQFDSQLKEVWRKSRSLVKEILINLEKIISPSHRLNYLTKLVSLNLSLPLVHDVVEALKYYLTQWQYTTCIRDWIPEGIGLFLEQNLPSLLFSWYNRDYRSLEKLLSLPNLTRENKTQMLLCAVVKHIEVLSPQEFYTVAKSLAVSLPDLQLCDILDWSLNRTEKQVARDSNNIFSSNSVSSPDKAPSVLAQFIWALFGHPDKRVRWRALHAARAIAKLPNQSFIDELVGLSWSETAGAFRSAQLEFYWMSARTWLMLLFQRLAYEIPDNLQEHAQIISEHALNSTFPHAQIREIAKQTALHLANNSPQCLPLDVVENLHFANTPSACLYPRENRYEFRTNSWEEVEKFKSESRFSFDRMDTLPYWYAPASRVFGYTKPDIAQHAEKWVCDKWGRTDQDWYSDIRELGNREKWRKMSKSHGTIPVLENLHTYLEYHAMFCAAGEMVDSKLPIYVDTYEDAKCPWKEWIRGHLNASFNYWIADIRSSTPSRPDCWGHFLPIKDWLHEYTLDEFDSGIGLTEEKHTGEIVIWGSIDLYDSQRHGYLRIKSALVNPTTSRSLLHALQTTDYYNFQLPIEGPVSGDFEINELGFELQSWVRLARQEAEALDQFDPLARDLRVESEIVTLGSDFLSSMELNRTPGSWDYIKSNGVKVAYMETWSDSLQAEYITEAFSSGQRWWVNIETLLGYLNHQNRDLIIEVRIAHNRFSHQRKEGENYDPGKSTIYLLRQNGILETIGRCCDIRQADSARTQSRE